MNVLMSAIFAPVPLLVAANVAAKIPDAAFSGLLILDFEGWRPAAADNDAVYPEGYTLSKYTQHSRSLVRVSHPDCERRQPTPGTTRRSLRNARRVGGEGDGGGGVAV